jgi:hypothetical protein
METMEHTDAVQLQAVEKYILGELAPALRNEFEAHYFDCHECALNVRAGIAFAAASRQYFAEVPVPAVVAPPAAAGWFSWLKPMIAVPAFAALLLLIGYQNLFIIPHLKQASVADAEVRPWFTLVAANVRGSAGTRVEVPSGKAFDLFFDVTTAPRQPDSVFLVQMKDSSGKILVARKVSQQLAKKPVNFTVPAGIPEGDYKLVILDQSAGTTAPAGEIPFTVAFSPQIQQH